MQALVFAFWVSVAFLPWAIAFGSLKSWRKGFSKHIPKVQAEGTDGEISSPVKVNEQTEYTNKMS